MQRQRRFRGLRDAASAATLLGAALTLALPPAPATGGRLIGSVLLTLLLAAIAIEFLPLNFPDRTGVTLTALPTILLWHDAGPFVAAVVAGGTISIVHASRRQPAPVLCAAVAIVAVWAADGAAAASQVIVPHTISGVGIAGGNVPWVAIAVFGVAFSLVAAALGAILLGAGHGPFEPIASLLMAPLAIVLIELIDQRGQDLLPLLMVSFGGILLLVRSSVNVATLHRRVTLLARRNEDIAQALAVERDTIAAVVAFSGDGIFTVDGTLRIRHFNPALAALTGQPVENAVGRAAEDVLGPHHGLAIVDGLLRQALREGRAVRVNSTLDRPEGQRELTTTYSVIPDPGGRVALGVGVVRDVTQEREEARLREDYFSLVTHDLRNPLTAIIGYTHLLDRELTAALGDDAPVRRRIKQIDGANERLLRLVNNLLELQRIETGHELLRPETVPLRPLLEEVVAEFGDAATARDQQLDASGPNLLALADRTWAREILTNLVSNAIKYTPPGGTISLSVECRDGFAAVDVADTGYGLIPDELERLFTKFFRSKRPEMRASSGTGLGLALAKSMAARMGGDITVRSAVGVGSVFTVLLPLTYGAVIAPSPGTAADDTAPKAVTMSLSNP